jgi:phosphate transport system protein
MLEERIAILKKELIGFAGHVENMIEKCIDGLLKRDREMLLSVVEKDEQKANAYEISLDEMSIRLIAQFEPKAKDLRTILMVMKMNNDLERMGDHAVNIAESGLYLIEKPPLKPLIDIPRMAEEAVKMVSDSLSSFIHEDAVLAKTVCERDNVVDGLASEVLGELEAYMSTNANAIERSLRLLKISGNLERIADLSTNICEDVIFMVEGRVIKHGAERQQ